MKKDYLLDQELEALGKKIEDYAESIISRAKTGMSAIAAQTHGLILEKAQNTLHSSRQLYVDSLFITNEGDNIWVVGLKPEANWIEDGIEPHNMIDDLLFGKNGKTPKRGKNGFYKVIPFQHNKNPQTMSRAESRIAEYAKQELERLKLDKTIMDSQGKPVLGKAAVVNLTGDDSPKSKLGNPILAGLTIYQREQKMAGGKTKIQRDIMTFRVVSESQRGKGMWDHPGTKPLNAFKEVEGRIDDLWRKLVAELF